MMVSRRSSGRGSPPPASTMLLTSSLTSLLACISTFIRAGNLDPVRLATRCADYYLCLEEIVTTQRVIRVNVSWSMYKSDASRQAGAVTGQLRAETQLLLYAARSKP